MKKAIIPIIFLVIAFCLFGCDKEATTTAKLDPATGIAEESATMQTDRIESYSNEGDYYLNTSEKSTNYSNRESNVMNNKNKINKSDYTKPSDDGSTTENAEYTLMGGIDRFKAVVVDISNSEIVVEPIDGEYERSFTELISFESHTEDKEPDNYPILSIGDTILIYYSNIDMNVSPPRLDHVYKYEVINES